MKCYKYPGASEEYGEQHYDCSSEESDIESKLRVNFNDKSKERDIVAPANSTTSSKGKNSRLNKIHIYIYIYDVVFNSI